MPEAKSLASFYEVSEPFDIELKRVATCWILKLKETGKLIQSTMESNIDNVTDFNHFLFTKPFGMIAQTLTDLGLTTDIISLLFKMFQLDNPYMQPFWGLET